MNLIQEVESLILSNYLSKWSTIGLLKYIEKSQENCILSVTKAPLEVVLEKYLIDKLIYIFTNDIVSNRLKKT